MKSFTEYLTESLTSGYPYQYVHSSGGGGDTIFAARHYFEFQDGNRHYTVIINVQTHDKVLRLDFKDTELGDHHITGLAASPVKLFATLGQILKNVLQQHPGFGVEFSSVNYQPTRLKLYKSLAARVANEMKGELSVRKGLSTTYFTIRPR